MPVPVYVFDADMTTHNITPVTGHQSTIKALSWWNNLLPKSYGPFNTILESNTRDEDVTSGKHFV